MRTTKHRDALWYVGLVCLMGLLVAMPAPARADGPLPPRGTVTPTPAPSGGGGGNGGSVGARIELHAVGVSGGAWAGVQWQDSAGGWRDVEGWQGTLAEDGTQSWWVAGRDFGGGPFRWVVTGGPEGALLTSSAPFNLPGVPGQVLVVDVVAGTQE